MAFGFFEECDGRHELCYCIRMNSVGKLSRRSAIVSWLAALCLGCPVAAEPGWELHQKSELVGDTVLLVSKKRFCLKVARSGSSIMGESPEWNIAWLTHRNKRRFDCSSKLFPKYSSEWEMRLMNKHFGNRKPKL